MRPWKVFYFAALVIIGLIGFLLHHRAAPESSVCAVVHENPAGCPAGYMREKQPRFTEKNGSKQFACVSRDPAKQNCIDVLKPGESMGLEIEIESDDVPPRPRT
jgi:hypothetical protein